MKLSKPLYTSGLQYSKALWLKKYKNVLTPLEIQAKAIFEPGYKVVA